jgi:hypothetical protein
LLFHPLGLGGLGCSAAGDVQMEGAVTRQWKGMAFPPNFGRVIGRLDANGNLVMVVDHEKESPDGVHIRACDSTLDNRLQTKCDPPDTRTLPLS